MREDQTALWSLKLDAIGESPVLVARFARTQEVASWAIVGGGRRRTQTVVWQEVRNADLPAHVDPAAFCRARLDARGFTDAVGFLTSRRVERHHVSHAAHAGHAASALATVGLSNALAVSDTPGPLLGKAPWGTINVLIAVSCPLTETAAWEAMSIAVEARTAAVIAAGVQSRRSTAIATGTGTDCLALAWPADVAAENVAAYAGKHTSVGHLIGATVRQAVSAGVAEWLEENPLGRMPRS